MNVARLFSYTRSVEAQLAKAESRIADLERLTHEQQNYILFLLDRPPLETIQPKDVETVIQPTTRGFRSLAQLRKHAAQHVKDAAAQFMAQQDVSSNSTTNGTSAS